MSTKKYETDLEDIILWPKIMLKGKIKMMELVYAGAGGVGGYYVANMMFPGNTLAIAGIAYVGAGLVYSFYKPSPGHQNKKGSSSSSAKGGKQMMY